MVWPKIEACDDQSLLLQYIFFFASNVIYSRNPVMENLGIKAKGKTRKGKNFAEF